MDGSTLMLIAGIVMGGALFLGGACGAYGYVTRKSRGPLPPVGQGLRGLAWIALMACGGLYIFTSLTFMGRLKQTEAELTRRQKIVAAQDRKITLYREGLRTLQATLASARGDAASEALARHIETQLADLRGRERKLP
jgi:hypothetical protein